MTNKSQPGVNPLGPIVTVQKRGLPVHVGIVDSNRLMAHGFDVDYPATIHFRTMRHGPFSVLVATKSAVEVRVLMDGKLLCEQRLDPLPQPMRDHGERSAVRRQVNESVNSPQPFFINMQNDGMPLAFIADPQGRSAEDRLQLQLHPDRFTPAADGPATVHRHEPVGQTHAKMDVDPAKLLGLFAPPPAPVNNDQPHDGATTGGANVGSLADALSSDDGSSTAETPAQLVPASAQLPVDEHQAEPEDHVHFDVPLPRMAPSYGMIAVGVRLVQVVVDGEPPQAPDGFDWVLFQVNTWEDHNRVRANLHSRIQMPAKVPYREIDDGTAQGSDTHTVHGSGCGCSHGHNPRRFR